MERCKTSSLPKKYVRVQTVCDHDGVYWIKIDSSQGIVSVWGILGVNIRANYFDWMQSNIVFAGFPILMGSLSNAKRGRALMDPAPGSNPSALGNVLSSLVTRNRQLGLQVRYCKAFELRVVYLSLPRQNRAEVSSSLVTPYRAHPGLIRIPLQGHRWSRLS